MKTKLMIAGIGVMTVFGLAPVAALASTTSSSRGRLPLPNVLPQTLPPVVPALLPQSPAAAGTGTGTGTGTVGSSGSTGSTGYSSSVHSASGGGTDYNSSTGAYTPPEHGTQPHGEGTGLSVTKEPRPAPDTSNCAAPSSDEVAVVGRSCGQQNSDGSYRGHVTILALGGQELLGENSTASGTTTTGSLAPLAGPILSQLNGALSQVCSGSSQNVCLSLLNANSSSTSTGSTSSFQAARASVGGSSGFSASALSSNGDISQTGSCQKASGGSSVADLSGGGTTIVSAGTSSDSSRACQDSSQNSQSASSHVLGGAVSPLTSPLLGGGCAAGTPNTPVKPLGAALPPQVAAIICNATDSNGAQARAPYGTNDGLSAIVVGALGVQAPSSESLAQAPARVASASLTAAPPAISPAAVPAAAPAAPVAAASGRLAFTGVDLLLEVLIALALLGAGGAAWLASRRRSA